MRESRNRRSQRNSVDRRHGRHSRDVEESSILRRRRESEVRTKAQTCWMLSIRHQGLHLGHLISTVSCWCWKLKDIVSCTAWLRASMIVLRLRCFYEVRWVKICREMREMLARDCEMLEFPGVKFALNCAIALHSVSLKSRRNYGPCSSVSGNGDFSVGSPPRRPSPGGWDRRRGFPLAR